MSAGNDREFIDFLQSKEKGGRSMKCPLIAIAWGNLAKNQPVIYPDCLKEECAWWNSELEACSVVSLELELASLVEVLTAIGSKMPHEEQFRK